MNVYLVLMYMVAVAGLVSWLYEPPLPESPMYEKRFNFGQHAHLNVIVDFFHWFFGLSVQVIGGTTYLTLGIAFIQFELVLG